MHDRLHGGVNFNGFGFFRTHDNSILLIGRQRLSARGAMPIIATPIPAKTLNTCLSLFRRLSCTSFTGL
jgi:hypothetical protein